MENPRRCFDCAISDNVEHQKFGWFLESIIAHREELSRHEEFLFADDAPLRQPQAKVELERLLSHIDQVAQQLPLDGVWKTATVQSLESSNL